MKRIALSVGAVVMGVMAMAGCSKEGTAPVKDPGDKANSGKLALSDEQQKAVGDAVKDNDNGGLQISAEILKLCPGIKPPEFSYDSSKVNGQWGQALGTLAQCMNEGKLKDRAIILTGHTDERGDDDYNMALGNRRASSVKKALGSLKVSASRVDVTSRGEIDATGRDKDGWAKDRRVDIDLRPGSLGFPPSAL